MNREETRQYLLDGNTLSIIFCHIDVTAQQSLCWSGCCHESFQNVEEALDFLRDVCEDDWDRVTK